MNKRYIPGLDEIRVTALLAVFLFHLLPGTFVGGYLGVEAFFILAGFLLAVKSLNMNRDQVIIFYKKKIINILGPALLMILVVSAWLRFLVPSEVWGLKAVTGSVLGCFFNFRQIFIAGDYFASIGAGSPFTHLWTLSIEMQFFLLWPLMAHIIGRFYRKDRSGTILGFGVFTFATALIMPVCAVNGVSSSFLYYFTGTRVFPMFLGVLAGMLYRAGNPVAYGFRFHPIAKYFSYAVSLVLAAILTIKADGTYAFIYRGGMALVSVWITFTLLLTAGMPERSVKNRTGRYQSKRFSRKQTPSGFGLFCRRFSSMGLEFYLWQYPVIFFCNALIGYNAAAKVTEVFLTIALAIWNHYFFNGMIRFFNVTFREMFSESKNKGRRTFPFRRFFTRIIRQI
ncbi:MAG: acyltransferase [Lachnospiraceae bacterium]|nr:acyltransferase [Lachnospiraceae bacterium]MEE3461468.1 acyltransferase [Lachnospiraceae bacterium]